MKKNLHFLYIIIHISMACVFFSYSYISHAREITLPSSTNINYKATCANSKYEIYYTSSWGNDISKIIYMKYNDKKINIESINNLIGSKGLQLINIWCYKKNSPDKLSVKNGDAVAIARLGMPNQIMRVGKSNLKISILSGKAEIINEVDKDEPHIQFFEPN